MSRISKLSFGAAIATSLCIVSYVHFKQQFDRQQVHIGVMRDVEGQQKRKTENLYLLQKQIQLTRQLKQEANYKHNPTDEVT